MVQPSRYRTRLNRKMFPSPEQAINVPVSASSESSTSLPHLHQAPPLRTLVLLVGFPASTKSTWAREYANENKPHVEIVSRDIQGGKAVDLIPLVYQLLKAGKTVIVDNTNMTKDIRQPFISIANDLNIPVHAVYFRTSIEDCQIRMLHRTWEKYGEIYLKGKAEKGAPAAKDPGVFPPATLFAARKRLEEPQEEEGYASIQVHEVPAVSWNMRTYKNKALFLDIDGTVRVSEGLPMKYPTKPSEVKLLHDDVGMKSVLDKYRNKGYMVIGISNQSGIAKGTITETNVKACMTRTQELLGLNQETFPITYCPHSPAPISCYCRKPQVGIAMQFIERYNLNPAECIMVGDSKTDETMATRLGMTFIHTTTFW